MPELVCDRITILTSDGKDHTARNNRVDNEFDGAALDALVQEFLANSDYELKDITHYYLFTESVSTVEKNEWEKTQKEKGVLPVVEVKAPLVRSKKFTSTGE